MKVARSGGGGGGAIQERYTQARLMVQRLTNSVNCINNKFLLLTLVIRLVKRLAAD